MRNLLLILLFTLISIHLNAKQYFIATWGNDASPGTIEKPFATFLQAHKTALPGDTIWVRGGVHQVSTIWTISKAGQLSAYYNLWGFRPDIERGDSVILNVSASNGIRIQLTAGFWHIRDLIIQNSSDNGMRIEGSYNIIERCVFRNNADTGLTIQQSNGTLPNDGTIAAFNLVLNCDSYYNDRDVSNADGFACKLSPGAGNVFRGCRAWANGDDGWDFYYSRFQIIVDNCWTFSNGIKGGNGNGFKSNGSASSSSTPRTQAPHVYIRCIAFDHKYKAGSNNKGFDQNHNEGNVTMINCLAFDNEKNYAYYKDTQNNKNHVLRNCVGFEPYSERLARTLLPGEIINAGTNDEISYMSSNTWFGNTIDASFNSWDINKSNPGWNPSRNDYVSLTLNDAKAPRQADGSLPNNGFGRLKPESLMKNAGISHLWELELPLSAYPNNPTKPRYITGLLVTSPDGMPDLGPFEIPGEINPDNLAPVVFLTHPSQNTELKTNETITLQASTTDTDGTVVRVEFFANNQFVGKALAAPWEIQWTPKQPGEYLIKAKSFDQQGAFAMSNAVSVQVIDLSGTVTGAKVRVLHLPGTSFTDLIQQRNWSTLNSTSVSGGKIKLTFSSNKGGTLFSPVIPMQQFLPDSLNMTFASSGGGSRNLNIYVSSDGGGSYSPAFVQAGAANGVAVPVRFRLSDKVVGEGDFVLKLEAANTVELWNVEVLAFEKIKSDIKPKPMIFNKIRCFPEVTTGFLVLSMELQESATVAIDLYNMHGQKVMQIESQTYPAGTSRIIADISLNPAGMYLVRLRAGQETVTIKVMKN